MSRGRYRQWGERFIPHRWMNIFLDPGIKDDRRIARRLVRKHGGSFDTVRVGSWTRYVLHGEALAHCLEEWWEKRGGRGLWSRPLGDAARYLRRKK